ALRRPDRPPRGDATRTRRAVAGRQGGAADLRGLHGRQPAVRPDDDRAGVRLRRHHLARHRAEHRAGPRRHGRPRPVVPRRHGRRGAEGRRHHRPPARCRDHAVPPAGRLPPPGHPPLPRAPAGLAPGPLHRRAAVQRQQRRRGDLVPHRAVPLRRRRHPHAHRHAGSAVRHRPRARPRRVDRLPRHRGAHGPVRAAHVAADDTRAAAARRGQRHRARVLRRRAGRQDARPGGRRDRALPAEVARAARRHDGGRPGAGHVRPGHGGAAGRRRARRAARRHEPRRQRRHLRRAARDGGLPVHPARLPRARHRLGAQRAAPVGRGLGPGAAGPAGHGCAGARRRAAGPRRRRGTGRRGGVLRVRRHAGPGRGQLRRPSRPHRRAGRPDRRREVHAGLGARAAARPRHRPRGVRRRRPAGARSGCGRRGRLARAAVDVPVRRHGARQPHARRGPQRRGHLGGAAGGPGRRLRGRAAAGPGHRRRRARHHAVRRSAPAPGPRPGRRAPAAAPGPRRRDQQRRPAGRAAHPGGSAGQRRCQHGRRHRLPPGDHRAGRRGGLRRGRPDRSPGHARRAARGVRGLPGPRPRLRARGGPAGRRRRGAPRLGRRRAGRRRRRDGV
ncbi:MAG: Heterodimeric efflux ABC transporter, permease/ATP-binding subunit 1, partial [uncultured Frankineae bacterium]